MWPELARSIPAGNCCGQPSSRGLRAQHPPPHSIFCKYSNQSRSSVVSQPGKDLVKLRLLVEGAKQPFACGDAAFAGEANTLADRSPQFHASLWSASREIVDGISPWTAAERSLPRLRQNGLENELRAGGVEATAYSTVALDAALRADHVLLGPYTTVIHGEAALASTREQERLLSAVESSGACLILVGDLRQLDAVGAGGLWVELE